MIDIKLHAPDRNQARGLYLSAIRTISAFSFSSRVSLVTDATLKLPVLEINGSRLPWEGDPHPDDLPRILLQWAEGAFKEIH